MNNPYRNRYKLILLLIVVGFCFAASSINAAITTTGNVVTGVSGSGPGYNGVDDPWANINLSVGYNAPGSITISGGSVVNTSNDSGFIITPIAKFSGSGGSSVVVTGLNSKWNVAEYLIVGHAANGSLQVTDGGIVTAKSLDVGAVTGGTGIATIGGGTALSTYTASELAIIYNGTLNIISGGGLNTGSVESKVGNYPGATGIANVGDDSGTATWSNAGPLTIGTSGNGVLNINGGGAVTNKNATIASANGISGTVSVGGGTLQAVWTIDGSLRIGPTTNTLGSYNGGLGTLNINTNGLVVAKDLAGRRFDANHTSTINLNGGTLRVTQTDVASNTFNLLGNGGTFDLPNFGNTLTIDTSVSGSGKLKTTGPGCLALSAANTYTGDTEITNGVFRLTNNGSIASSPTIIVKQNAVFDLLGGLSGGANFSNGRFTVAPGQTIKGTGTIFGPMGIGANATLAPGEGIGTLSLQHDLFLDANSSTLNIDIDFSGNGNADYLSLLSNASLNNSTLDLDFLSPELFTTPKTFLIVGKSGSAPVIGNFGSIAGVPGMIVSVNYAFSGTDSLGRVGTGNDIAVTIMAVPEPSTIALAGLGAIGLIVAARRHKAITR